MAEHVMALQHKIETDTKDLQNLQKDMQRLIDGRQRLVEQQNENELVKREFDLLEKEAKVYKLIGTVLVTQTLVESKDNVNKRLNFIVNELKKVEDIINDNTQKQMNKRKVIQTSQEQLYNIVYAHNQAQQKAQSQQ